jgi:Tfp pilus assembly protein PilF
VTARRLWQPTLVLAAAILCYVQTAGYRFVWDDAEQIAANDRIRSFEHLGAAFQENVWAFRGSEVRGNYFRPLQTVAYMAAYAAGGLSPVPFHWLNILLHGLTSLAVYWLGRELFRDHVIALCGGLLFAVHPMHTESVAWAAGITDVGCALFYCAGLAAYARARRAGFGWLALSAAAFLGALLFKEMAFTLPVMAAAMDSALAGGAAGDSGRRRWLRWTVLLLPAGVYLVLRIHALGFLWIKTQSFTLGWGDRILTVAYLAGLYVSKLVLPAAHNAYRVFVPFSGLGFPEWAPPITALVCCAGLLWLLRREAKPAFLGGWVLIALIPVLRLEGVGQNVFAERYLYIPSVGFCLLLPALARRYAPGISGRNASILAAAVVIILGILTIRRNPVWRDDRSLCAATLEVSPDAAMMHQNLGAALYGEKDFAGALREFEAARAAERKAFVRSPRDECNALIGMGMVYLDTHELDRAWQCAVEARARDPRRAEASRLLGAIRYRQGRNSEAEPWLRQAVSLDPRDISARLTLGWVLLAGGDATGAEPQFRTVLAMDPRSVPARLGLAVISEMTSRHAEALRLLNEVLSMDPGNAEAASLLKEIGARAPGR